MSEVTNWLQGYVITTGYQCFFGQQSDQSVVSWSYWELINLFAFLWRYLASNIGGCTIHMSKSNQSVHGFSTFTVSKSLVSW